MEDKQLFVDSDVVEEPLMLPHPAHSSAGDGSDIETLVEQVWTELGGTVERPVVSRVVQDVVSRYENARVKSFVPILIRKEALDQLR